MRSCFRFNLCSCAKAFSLSLSLFRLICSDGQFWCSRHRGTWSCAAWDMIRLPRVRIRGRSVCSCTDSRWPCQWSDTWPPGSVCSLPWLDPRSVPRHLFCSHEITFHDNKKSHINNYLKYKYIHRFWRYLWARRVEHRWRWCSGRLAAC